MTIGEIARRSGFSIKALRFYDRRGLLPPSSRSASGYRLYGEPDLHRLEFIRQAKALGLTLDAIHELVVAARGDDAGMTRSRLREVLRERLVHVARQIESLTGLKQTLEHRQRVLARKRPCRGNGYCTCLHQNGSGPR